MPVYVYKCLNKECAEIYEISRPVDNRDDPAQCGKCRNEIKRLFTAPAVTFKGGGFYRTDSRIQHKTAVAKVGGNNGKKEGKEKEQ